jgi:hypothetical protein
VASDPLFTPAVRARSRRRPPVTQTVFPGEALDDLADDVVHATGRREDAPAAPAVVAALDDAEARNRALEAQNTWLAERLACTHAALRVLRWSPRMARAAAEGLADAELAANVRGRR